jgi:hypothetical protein
MARRSQALPFTPPSGGGRRLVAVKLASLVAAALAITWWAVSHPMSQLGYLVAGLLALGVVGVLAQHRRNGRRLVLVVVEWLMVLALASVLTGGPGSRFLAPNAPGKPAQRATTNPQPATAGDQPGSIVEGLWATCDRFDLCRGLHQGIGRFVNGNGGALRQAMGLLFGKGK